MMQYDQQRSTDVSKHLGADEGYRNSNMTIDKTDPTLSANTTGTLPKHYQNPMEDYRLPNFFFF
jgi:hypothetical protein